MHGTRCPPPSLVKQDAPSRRDPGTLPRSRVSGVDLRFLFLWLPAFDLLFLVPGLQRRKKHASRRCPSSYGKSSSSFSGIIIGRPPAAGAGEAFSTCLLHQCPPNQNVLSLSRLRTPFSVDLAVRLGQLSVRRHLHGLLPELCSSIAKALSNTKSVAPHSRTCVRRAALWAPTLCEDRPHQTRFYGYYPFHELHLLEPLPSAAWLARL